MYIFNYLYYIWYISWLCSIFIFNITSIKIIISILYTTSIYKFIIIIYYTINNMYIWYNKCINYKNNKNKFKISWI